MKLEYFYVLILIALTSGYPPYPQRRATPMPLNNLPMQHGTPHKYTIYPYLLDDRMSHLYPPLNNLDYDAYDEDISTLENGHSNNYITQRAQEEYSLGYEYISNQMESNYYPTYQIQETPRRAPIYRAFPEREPSLEDNIAGICSTPYSTAAHDVPLSGKEAQERNDEITDIEPDIPDSSGLDCSEILDFVHDIDVIYFDADRNSYETFDKETMLALHSYLDEDLSLP